MKAILALCLISVALAAPLLRAPLHEEGDVIPGSYLVVMKDGAKLAQFQSLAQSVGVDKVWDIKDKFFGFSGKFSDELVESIRMRTDLVEFVERDQIFRTSARQTNPPSWGLGASSSQSATNPGFYDYPDHGGAGVKLYVIDTGIRCTHNDFGNRCVWGARFGQGGEADGNGHGTHCAGTAAGTQYGIAKSASLIAVGVLGPTGSGSTADVVSGVEYSSDNCGTASNCVGSMSLGGGASTALDNAVNAAVDGRYFMAVAAGNSNANAQNYSPARAAGSYTVMATDSAARKASYSNYGAVCQIWAPGSSITSAWSTSDTATNTISGTSMACPHVAGAGALAFTSGHGGAANGIENRINSHGVNNAITGVPAGTVNRFLHVNPQF